VVEKERKGERERERERERKGEKERERERRVLKLQTIILARKCRVRKCDISRYF
jgi:hypothetical protein